MNWATMSSLRRKQLAIEIFRVPKQMNWSRWVVRLGTGPDGMTDSVMLRRQMVFAEIGDAFGTVVKCDSIA